MTERVRVVPPWHKADKEANEPEEVKLARSVMEQYYGDVVYPLDKVCWTIYQWVQCIEDLNHPDVVAQDPTRWRQGQDYYKWLQYIWIDIRKSNLLGRLLYLKETFRTI